jgi:transposase
MQTKLYVGLDLHSTNTYIGVIDEQERRVLKGKFPNQLEVILSMLDPHREQIAGVVVESTFNWYWLVDGLMDNGYKVHLAHPPAMQPYSGLKHTDDEHDAFFLATMLKLGILPEGHIMPREERQMRDLLRKRLKLVRQRSTHILSFKSLLSRNLGFTMPSNEVKKLEDDEMNDMFDDEHLALSAKVNIAAMNNLKWQINEIQYALLKAVKLKPQFEKLLTVPGIGNILAMTIALETGDVGRFPSVGDFASYCRCVNSRRLSNDKVKGSNNRKNGNKYLSFAFVEAAQMTRRYCQPAQAFFMRKSAKTNKIVATKALAHKLARACYYIMRDQVDFDETKIFGKPSKVEKGCAREPKRGLGDQPSAPIGITGAAPNHLDHTAAQ